MTNNEIRIQEAVKNMESGKLTSWETDFVNSIKDFSKKELNKLSVKQFDALRKIANK